MNYLNKYLKFILVVVHFEMKKCSQSFMKVNKLSVFR